MKRLMDIVIACVLLLFLSPLMLLISVLILVKDDKPVFFSQLRPGKRGELFRLFKFRTMSNEYDVEGRKLPDEERLTMTGIYLRKFSLDELPQLWNVILGEMSLVGPRPLLVEYLKLYSKKQARRHEVKPGITGWAQVNGRNAISWQEKFELDVWYVDNQSILLDLKIIFMTLYKTAKSEGVSQEEYVTARPFEGNE